MADLSPFLIWKHSTWNTATTVAEAGATTDNYSNITNVSQAQVAAANTVNLGVFMSATPWSGSTVNDLFDNIDIYNLSADTFNDYRCIFIHNTHPTYTLSNSKIYIYSEQADGALISLAKDAYGPFAVTTNGTKSAGMVNRFNDGVGYLTSPSIYTSPVDYASGINIGTIAPGQHQAIWIKRTVSPLTATENLMDGFTLALEGTYVDESSTTLTAQTLTQATWAYQEYSFDKIVVISSSPSTGSGSSTLPLTRYTNFGITSPTIIEDNTVGYNWLPNWNSASISGVTAYKIG